MGVSVGREFGWLKYHFERVDKDDYSKGCYVSSIVWKDKGSGWYEGIEFDAPESIDHLIHALVDAKAKAEWQGIFAPDESTFMVVRDANYRQDVELDKDGTYHCPWCDTPIPEDSWPEYSQGRPKYCMNCGLRFDEFKPKGD